MPNGAVKLVGLLLALLSNYMGGGDNVTLCHDPRRCTSRVLADFRVWLFMLLSFSAFHLLPAPNEEISTVSSCLFASLRFPAESGRGFFIFVCFRFWTRLRRVLMDYLFMFWEIL